MGLGVGWGIVNLREKGVNAPWAWVRLCSPLALYVALSFTFLNPAILWERSHFQSLSWPLHSTHYCRLWFTSLEKLKQPFPS